MTCCEFLAVFEFSENEDTEVDHLVDTRFMILVNTSSVIPYAIPEVWDVVNFGLQPTRCSTSTALSDVECQQRSNLPIYKSTNYIYIPHS